MSRNLGQLNEAITRQYEKADKAFKWAGILGGGSLIQLGYSTMEYLNSSHVPHPTLTVIAGVAFTGAGISFLEGRDRNKQGDALSQVWWDHSLQYEPKENAPEEVVFDWQQQKALE